jgi:hypothetical protein
MSKKGEKCLELVLLDGSNYESWCNSILYNIEAFNPYLLSIVDSSICPPNIEAFNPYLLSICRFKSLFERLQEQESLL